MIAFVKSAEKWLMQSHSLSYPKSRYAIASYKVPLHVQDLAFNKLSFVSSYNGIFHYPFLNPNSTTLQPTTIFKKNYLLRFNKLR